MLTIEQQLTLLETKGEGNVSVSCAGRYPDIGRNCCIPMPRVTFEIQPISILWQKEVLIPASTKETEPTTSFSESSYSQIHFVSCVPPAGFAFGGGGRRGAQNKSAYTQRSNISGGKINHR